MHPVYTDQLQLIYRKYKFHSDFPILLMQETEPASCAFFMHFHNCIEIGICEKSLKKWSIENHAYDFLPGEVCFIPPYYSHSSYRPASVTGEALYTYIFFNPEDILQPIYPNGLPQKMLFYKYINFSNILNSSEFEQEIKLIYRIRDELLHKHQNYQLSVRGLIQALMSAFSSHFAEMRDLQYTARPLSRIMPAVSYLHDSFRQNTPTAQLAEICHMNQKQFVKEFYENLHQTPLQYLNIVRVQNACELLTSTEDSILCIAFSVGFQSISTFNRCFRNILGTNPQNWRNEKRTIVKKNLKFSSYDATHISLLDLPLS